MHICPKKAIAALNLVAVVVVVWLYCLDKIDANPIAAMPDQLSALQTPDSKEASQSVELHKVGIIMTDIRLPVPPPVLEVTPSPEVAGSQKTSNTQALSEPASAVNPTLTPLAPQTALHHVAAKPLMEQPAQRNPTASARLAVPARPKTVTVPPLRPIAVAPSPPAPLPKTLSAQTFLPYTRAPQTITRQDIHISQASVLRGLQMLDLVADKGELDMEIFWPDTARQSAYLYNIMTRCFGMRSAVLNGAGELVSSVGKGKTNHAGLSPLIRQLKQPASRDEADVIAKIVVQQRVSGASRPVRIFTKSVDARLFDGIAQLTGKQISPNSVLRANYVIDRGRIFVANITHDGVRATGRVLLVDGGC